MTRFKTNLTTVTEAFRFVQEMEKVGSHMVVCKVTFGDAPTCDKIAKEFADGGFSDGKFTVTVQKANQNQCSSYYDEDGKNLGKAAGNVELPK